MGMGRTIEAEDVAEDQSVVAEAGWAASSAQNEAVDERSWWTPKDELRRLRYRPTCTSCEAAIHAEIIPTPYAIHCPPAYACQTRRGGQSRKERVGFNHQPGSRPGDRSVPRAGLAEDYHGGCYQPRSIQGTVKAQLRPDKLRSRGHSSTSSCTGQNPRSKPPPFSILLCTRNPSWGEWTCAQIPLRGPTPLLPRLLAGRAPCLRGRRAYNSGSAPSHIVFRRCNGNMQPPYRLVGWMGLSKDNMECVKA
ncbi:hypothetical protein FIBSPDRAFT_566690 [Athelia psychrophila]|uniref:Uncharacterized protein n=1 Tax=Athelia psychrophila TaxID=1759441 RepID=A0A166HZC8_9AGAM|nr:hypothetical protein FIBSPDRAFT_566690 [Fibularhizoctonia sp. CBS 109695]